MLCIFLILSTAWAISTFCFADSLASYDLLKWNPSEPGGGWRRWFPRAEIAPKLAESSDEGGTFIAAGAGRDWCIGGWERQVAGLKTGDAFEVHAEVECESLVNPPRALWIRVYWQGKMPADTPPEIVPIAATDESHYVFHDRIVVPRGATSATVRIIYRWEPHGRAVWRSVRMTPAGPEPAHRFVRIATVYWRPKARTTVEKNITSWLAMIDKAAREKPDFILLSEGVTAIGIGFGDLNAISEKVPGGPHFKRITAKAREHGCHIAYGTYEREGRYIFNTAVLIGPDGKLIGKYRKSHLPLEEDTAGFAPGDTVGVFDTDICKVGFVICFETDFPEVMRAARLKGAELILVPIWGGDEATLKVRARENGVTVVTASYDMKSMIVDKRGTVLAETWKGIGNGIAAATVDLDDRTKLPWTGCFPAYMTRIRMPQK